MSELTKSQLMHRGWPGRAIRKFLGPPDRTEKITGYKHDICWYDLARVEVAESNAEFRAERKRHYERKDTGTLTIETRRQRLIVRALQAEVDVIVARIAGDIDKTLKPYSRPQRAAVDHVINNLSNFAKLMDLCAGPRAREARIIMYARMQTVSLLTSAAVQTAHQRQPN